MQNVKLCRQPVIFTTRKLHWRKLITRILWFLVFNVFEKFKRLKRRVKRSLIVEIFTCFCLLSHFPKSFIKYWNGRSSWSHAGFEGHETDSASSHQLREHNIQREKWFTAVWLGKQPKLSSTKSIAAIASSFRQYLLGWNVFQLHLRS